MIFPEVKSNILGSGRFVIDGRITFNTDPLFSSLKGYLVYSLKSIHNLLAEETAEADIEIRYSELSKEEYRLSVANNGILIEASDLRGAVYGISTLLQLIKRENEVYIDSCFICDAPDCEIRGVHFYMPERSKIDEFKRIVDTMALLKLNTVILEVGGAMEYERHPEINEAWVKFCENIGKFPGHNGYKNFQGSDFYWKDSVHTEQAGGSYLTKNDVRDLVVYCKNLGFDVIPEVQGLSHSYYLTVAHPEIAELSDDPFPDTYCPSNEKSYELYFDVAEEVIEVFEPTTVSIGHDEIRVLGWCDKCKDKSGHELVGTEILRLYEFYNKKGIRITMWGESCQTFTSYKGSEVGKSNIEKRDRYGRYYQLPATYKAIEMLPNDILMIDWQHSTGHDSEECYSERGFEVIYGNFYGSLIGEWQRRYEKECVRGAEVSSWCPATEEIFARDGIFFEMAYSASILWNCDYKNEHYTAVCEKIAAIAPIMRAINRGERFAPSAEKSAITIYSGDADKAVAKITLSGSKILDDDIKKALSGMENTLYGVSVDSGEILIKKSFIADSIIFLHNTKKELPYFPSHYFMDEANWGLGCYAICYEDGTREVVSLYYGRQVGISSFKFERHRGKETVSFEIDTELEEGNVSTLPCYFTKDFAWTESLVYNTTPIFGEETTVFAYTWKNPHPDKTITAIRPYSVPKVFNEFDMEQSVVLYGIAAI